jgi:hypothetical protein
MNGNDPTEGLALMAKRFEKKTSRKTALCTKNLAKKILCHWMQPGTL